MGTFKAKSNFQNVCILKILTFALFAKFTFEISLNWNHAINKKTSRYLTRLNSNLTATKKYQLHQPSKCPSNGSHMGGKSQQ